MSSRSAAASAKSPRRRRHPDEARRLILDAAARLLAERGPDAVGLKAVAREAGVSHALVTHYFGTIDALIEAALQAHMTSTRAELLQRIADVAHAGPAEWLEMLFDQLAHPLSGRLVAWAILSGRMDSEDFFPRRDQGMRFVADAIEARLRAEHGEGGAPGRDTIELTMLVAFSAALGYSVSRAVLWDSLSKKPSAERDRAFRDRLAAMLTAALPTTAPPATALPATAPSQPEPSAATPAPRRARRKTR